MEPYEREQWEQLDRRLAEAEKKLLATANLVKAGIPMVTSHQMQIDALIDLDTRLYGRIQELTESIREHRESQRETDRRLDRLEVSIEKLVESMKPSGNGAS
jgi:uncharacterized protein YaaN involved in tellurite resistance